jgi:hypothetical protein
LQHTYVLKSQVTSIVLLLVRVLWACEGWFSVLGYGVDKHDLNCLEFCFGYEVMNRHFCRVAGWVTSLRGFELSLFKINFELESGVNECA